MSGIKEQFYSGLRADTRQNDDLSASFLYRQLAKEKDACILQERPAVPTGDIPKRADPYVLLKTCYTALEHGEIREADYLKTALRILIKNPKLRLTEMSRHMLWTYGECLRGDTAFDGARQNKQRYQALLRILEEGPAAQPLGKEKLDKLHAELLKCALEVDTRAFLYDAGYPISSQEEHAAAVPRKKDRLLDMLDAYCAEKRLSLQKQVAGRGAFSNELSPEEKKRCETLFQYLKRTGKTNALIPIRIDPLTGAGIYIVGADHFEGSLQDFPKSSHYYACFYPSFMYINDAEIISSCWLRSVEEALYPHLDEALAWYRRIILDDAYTVFKEGNGPAPANCPEEFRIYFERNAAEISLDPAEIEQAKAECGEPQRKNARNERRRKK